jgi:hypothetical protein
MQFSGDDLVMDLHLVSGRFDDKRTLGCSSGASLVSLVAQIAALFLASFFANRLKS